MRVRSSTYNKYVNCGKASRFLDRFTFSYPEIGKGKVRPRTGHKGPEGNRGIALLFL